MVDWLVGWTLIVLLNGWLVGWTVTVLFNGMFGWLDASMDGWLVG